MTFFNKPLLIAGFVSITTICYMPAQSAGNGRSSRETTLAVDFNEETHLVFMREEEKLARDVYRFLAAEYPEVIAFQNIDDAEQQHTTKVKETLDIYGIPDPNPYTDDVDSEGEFLGVDYGAYFEGKYEFLINWGQDSELDALRVGAFIEELDMLDIVTCPKAIRDLYGLEVDDCGLEYTDNSNLQNVLGALLEGSENHLRSYVGNIEAIAGKCTYRAQVLSQIRVDTILGRVGECDYDYE